MMPIQTNDRSAELGLLERLTMPIWLWDLDRNGLVWANAPALALWGEATLEKLRRRIDELAPVGPTQRQEWRARILRQETIEDSWSLPRDREQISVPFRGVPFGLNDGGTMMLVEALGEAGDSASGSDRLLADAMRIANQATLVARVAAAGEPPRVEFVNAAFEQLTGYAAADLAATAAQLFSEADGTMPALAELRAAWAAARSCRVDLVVRRRDGSTFEAECRLQPLPDERGDVSHLLLHLNDRADRRRSEVRLREGRDQMRLLVNTVPACLAYVGPDERFRFANPAFLDWFQCPPEPLIGVAASEVLRADYRLLGPALQQGLAGERVTLLLERGDDDGRVGQVAVVPDVATDGAVRGACLLVTDVTELTRASRALTAGDRRLRGFLDSAADWFWELGPDLSFIFVSDNLARALFRAPREVLGQYPWTLPELAGPPEAIAQLRRDLEARRDVRGAVMAVVDGSGRYRYLRLSASPSWDADGRFAGYTGSTADVTALIAAEQRAHAAEARYRLLAEQTTAGIFVAGPDLGVSFANQRFGELLGLSPADLRSNLWLRRVDPGDIAKILAAFDPRRPAERRRSVTFRYDHPDGRLRWLNCEATICDSGGPIPELVATLTDITEWKRREVDLRVGKENAERASAGKSAFLAATSHELRTPLNAIIGFCEIMQQQLFGPIGNARYRTYLDDIRDAGLGLLGLLNDLLDVARIEAGRIDVNAEAIDVTALIETTVRQLAPLAARLDVTSRLRVAPTLPKLYADGRHCGQMVTNLLTNAFKYSKRGGEVLIGAKLDAGGRLVIRVADAGIGMSPQQRRRALEPFVQVAADPTRRREGYGLGLYLVDALATTNGAEFALFSKVGRGTVARLVFPRKRVLG